MIDSKIKLSSSNILVSNNPYECKDLFVIVNNLTKRKIKKYKDLIINPEFIVTSFDEGDGIEELRRALGRYSLLSIENLKVFIVFELEKYSIEAQNILLKTLEEPFDNSYLFLITSNPDDLLPTIRSRCQILYTEDEIQNQDLKLFESKNLAESEMEKILVSTIDKREKAKVFIDRLIDTLKFLNLKDEDYYKKLKFIVKCRDYISDNVNLRLCMENAIIEVYK